MRIAIGIDVHKVNCALCAVRASPGTSSEPEQQLLDRLNKEFRRFPSDPDGMRQLESVLGHDHEVGILVENSTKTHDVYWMLTCLGYEVTVAHATDLYIITKSNSKNDDRDAERLAGYMRRRMNGEIEFAESFMAPAEWMDRREMSRIMADTRTSLSVAKKQVRAHLLRKGQHRPFDRMQDITTTHALNMLRDLNDPALRYYVARIENLKKTITMLEKTLKQMFLYDRMFEIIYSIPGFGVHSAAYLASEIVDISRFPTKTSLSGYAGMRPRQKDSADSLKNGSMSRRGDALMRRLVYQATFVHINNVEDSFITKKYQRLRKKGKCHKEAVVACSNSMLVMIWRMLRNDTVFESDPKVLAAARRAAAELSLDMDDDYELRFIDECRRDFEEFAEEAC